MNQILDPNPDACNCPPGPCSHEGQFCDLDAIGQQERAFIDACVVESSYWRRCAWLHFHPEAHVLAPLNDAEQLDPVECEGARRQEVQPTPVLSAEEYRRLRHAALEQQEAWWNETTLRRAIRSFVGTPLSDVELADQLRELCEFESSPVLASKVRDALESASEMHKTEASIGFAHEWLEIRRETEMPLTRETDCDDGFELSLLEMDKSHKKTTHAGAVNRVMKSMGIGPPMGASIARQLRTKKKAP